jgi:crossover junction endodeoxyribonuclease RuvC
VRVLGVDPGLTRCGLGMVEGQVGRQLHLIDVDVVRTAPDAPVALRLCRMAAALEEWLDIHSPDLVAIEGVFAQHNVKTVMGTAQVSGLAMVAAARRGIPVACHTPSEVKAAVTGNGRADKAQVTSMVTRLLKLSTRPAPADASDALALAICAVWRGAASRRLEEALARTVRGQR